MKVYVEKNESDAVSRTKKYCTFIIDNRLYGIDVMNVQEVTKPLTITPMRKTPNFIKGLINLRGQIATAIGLREFFNLKKDNTIEQLSIVCRIDDNLVSFVVDFVGDVLEVDDSQFENTPKNVPQEISRFLHGIYKTENQILSVLNVELILKDLEKRCA